jgi:hypothetical protein
MLRCRTPRLVQIVMVADMQLNPLDYKQRWGVAAKCGDSFKADRHGDDSGAVDLSLRCSAPPSADNRRTGFLQDLLSLSWKRTKQPLAARFPQSGPNFCEDCAEETEPTRGGRCNRVELNSTSPKSIMAKFTPFVLRTIRLGTTSVPGRCEEGVVSVTHKSLVSFK